MGTYYGYVKKDVDSQVDWGAVGKTFTDMLSAENTRRETLKKDIDDNSRKDVEQVSSIPKGSSEQFNKWQSAATMGIMNDKLSKLNALKSGKLSLQDYNTYTANSRTGVVNMTNYIKNYNSWYEDGMKRAQGNESQAAEIWKDSMLESMKFKDTAPIVALDGTMTVAKQIKNPETGLMEASKNPSDVFTFGSMMDFSKKKFDRFKVDAALDNIQKSAAEYTKVVGANGISTTSDIFLQDRNGKYLNQKAVDAINSSIESTIQNPNNAMSVLTDYMGKNPITGNKFEFTNNPDDPRLKGANRDDVIFMDETLSPVLTDGQQKMATDKLKQDFESRVGHTEQFYQKQQAQQPTSTQERNAEETRNMISSVKSWDRIGIARNPEERELATNAFLTSDAAKSAGLLNIDSKSEPGVLKLKYSNSTKDIDIPIPENPSRADWAQIATDITGAPLEVINKALGRGASNKIINSETSANRKMTAPKDVNKEFNSKIDSSIKRQNFEGQTSETTSEYINNEFGNIGIVAEPTSKFNNDIKVTFGDKSITINSKGNAAEAILNLNKLKTFIKNTIPLATKTSLLSDIAP